MVKNHVTRVNLVRRGEGGGKWDGNLFSNVLVINLESTSNLPSFASVVLIFLSDLERRKKVFVSIRVIGLSIWWCPSFQAFIILVHTIVLVDYSLSLFSCKFFLRWWY